jgi:Ca2+-binding RTX toxin-like protein
VHVNLAEGVSLGEGDDTLVGIEAVSGSEFDDEITGSAGDDLVYGQGGADTIDAGEGLDVVLYDFALGPVEVDLQTGSATGGDGDDTLGGFEGVVGSTWDDLLLGSDSDDYLAGRAGDDDLDGRGGVDVLEGDEGQDVCRNGELVNGCESAQPRPAPRSTTRAAAALDALRSLPLTLSRIQAASR